MNYIENIYVCLAAPILVAVFCVRSPGRRQLTFVLCGMTACLLSSYISTFLAVVQGTDPLMASLTIVPVVEEVMKLLPILFYLYVFEPQKEFVAGGTVMTAVGFATFENACYVARGDTARFLNLLIRGFGTGTMHVVCGIITAFGMIYLWDKPWVRLAGLLGLLAASVTYHGIFNILVSQTGTAWVLGSSIPVVTVILYLILDRVLPHRRTA